jgi:lipopolysaccharide biosynthesis regulator YciM
LKAAAGAINADREAAADAEQRVAALPPEACSAAEAAALGDADFAAAFVQGVLAQACTNKDTALKHFERSVAAAPDFVAARVQLGRMRLERYEWKEAIAAAAPDGVELPDDTRLEYILGAAYVGLAQGDHDDQGADHFRKAIRLNRANSEAMLALVDVYGRRQEANRAMRQLQTLVDQDPLNERGRELLFYAYLGDGDQRAAARQIEELRRISA